jgi:hypothetical protein
MAQTATLKATKRSTACCICNGTIPAGTISYLNAGSRWHPECADAKRCRSASAAPVASPVAAPVVAPPAPRRGYRPLVGGLLYVDESFTAWEREYDEEGR